MVESIEEVQDVFCSSCGSSVESFEPYGKFISKVGHRVRDRQCVIKCSEQDDGRVFLALRNPDSPEANRLELDLCDDSLVFSVDDVEGGLVLTPNHLRACCECGQNTIIEVDEYNFDGHVTDDYAAALKILTHFVGESDLEIVEDLVNSFDYPERVRNIIENPMNGDKEFNSAVDVLRKMKSSESFVTNPYLSDGGDKEVGPFRGMELKGISIDSTSTDEDGDDIVSKDLERDYASMFGNPSDSTSLEQDSVTTGLVGYSIKTDEDGESHLVDKNGDVVHQINGDKDNFVTVDADEIKEELNE